MGRHMGTEAGRWDSIDTLQGAAVTDREEGRGDFWAGAESEGTSPVR